MRNQSQKLKGREVEDLCETLAATNTQTRRAFTTPMCLRQQHAHTI